MLQRRIDTRGEQFDTFDSHTHDETTYGHSQYMGDHSFDPQSHAHSATHSHAVPHTFAATELHVEDAHRGYRSYTRTEVHTRGEQLPSTYAPVSVKTCCIDLAECVCKL